MSHENNCPAYKKVVYRTVALHYKTGYRLSNKVPQCIFPILFYLWLLPAWFRLM